MNEKNKINDRYHTINEVCEYLGVSRDTILRWIKNRNFPAYKIEHRWFCKTSEIDDWMKKEGKIERGQITK